MLACTHVVICLVESGRHTVRRTATATTDAYNIQMKPKRAGCELDAGDNDARSAHTSRTGASSVGVCANGTNAMHRQLCVARYTLTQRDCST
jgi:hypothetical protein